MHSTSDRITRLKKSRDGIARTENVCFVDDDILAGFLFRYTVNVNLPMSTSADFDPAGALRALIDTYYRKGGMEIQVSAVSRKTLLDAQAHPEQYGDLIVRVSDFSAYFTGLNLTTQNEIIERTEN